MPMFEYKCRECGNVSEFLVGVTATDPEIVCASCGGKKLDRIISTISVGRGQSRFKMAGGECACGHEGGGCADGTCACMN